VGDEPDCASIRFRSVKATPGSAAIRLRAHAKSRSTSISAVTAAPEDQHCHQGLFTCIYEASRPVFELAASQISHQSRWLSGPAANSTSARR
jgi:hypothetical protein